MLRLGGGRLADQLRDSRGRRILIVRPLAVVLVVGIHLHSLLTNWHKSAIELAVRCHRVGDVARRVEQRFRTGGTSTPTVSAVMRLYFRASTKFTLIRFAPPPK